MRIIAGKWRGLQLAAPAGLQTRPILDQVKEALFNILGAMLSVPGELPACAVLDLFAGSGSLGLEALSRGASWCTFVEGHRSAMRTLRANILRVDATDQVEVIGNNIWDLRFTRRINRSPFKLAFVDPPYKDALSLDSGTPLHQLLQHLVCSGLLAEEPIIVLRQPRQATTHQGAPAGLLRLDQRHYGTMTLSFLAPGK